ncbi:CG5342, partial [Drosophila busckii]
MLLATAYVIFFQSTNAPNLEPQLNLVKPTPANRLVVFLVDDLRSKAFFEQGCSNVPHLRELFQQQGQVGVTRSLAPSLKSSGYVDLFCGLYQTPATLLRSLWSRQEVNCVTFNQDVLSYVWASQEFFEKFPQLYKAGVIPSHITGYQLDDWVLQSLNDFLSNEATLLQKTKPMVLLVQLLSLKHSKRYRETLNSTQYNVWRAYQGMERAFPDGLTSYLLTSDGQMQAETPFYLWGAAIPYIEQSPGRSFMANELGKRLPLQVLQQVQLTPLMSTLLGLSPPTANQGRLPVELINASSRLEADASYKNALQLIHQAAHVVRLQQRGVFSKLMSSHWLTLALMDNFIFSCNLLWEQQRYLALKEYSSNYVPTILDCLAFYKGYYRRGMLFATACAFMGRLHQLRSLPPSPSSRRSKLSCVVYSLSFFLLLLVLLQRLSWLMSAVFLLPALIWTLAQRTRAKGSKGLSCRQSTGLILFALCCTSGFFQRRYIAALYFGYNCYYNRRSFLLRSRKFYLWLSLVSALTGLCWIPPSLGYSHRSILVISLLVTLAQPLFSGSLRKMRRNNLLCNVLVLVTAVLHVIYSPQPWMMHFIARAYLCYVLYPRDIQNGMQTILYNLSTVYALICTSYEAVVIQSLCLELQLGLYLKNERHTALSPRAQAIHLFLYSYYSFFVIGDIMAIDGFRFYMRFTGFGCYSTFINILLIIL